MNEDLNKSTKTIMSFTVVIGLIGIGIYLLMYFKNTGDSIFGYSSNNVLGTIFIIYGFIRAYLLYNSLKKQ